MLYVGLKNDSFTSVIKGEGLNTPLRTLLFTKVKFWLNKVAPVYLDAEWYILSIAKTVPDVPKSEAL